VGVPADLQAYRKSTMLYWNLREVLATVNALWEVHISHPIPVLGEPEPIFTEENP
jgi:SanA protein